MTRIKKAVIPAAGLGTRFLPITKSMPKEMLPIVDKPVIHYVVKEAVDSGIEDIIIVTGRGKRAIEDYFDASPELEMHLKKNGKEHLLKMVEDISTMANICYVRQKEPRGLGDAILMAEKHIGDEPFAVLLGDDIIVNEKPCLSQMIHIYKQLRAPLIAVEEIELKKVINYGIIKGNKLYDDIYEIEDIVEKPSVEDAPSRLGTVGRYLLSPEIFDCIREVKPGFAGEIQLTDAIRGLMMEQKVFGYKFHGRRYDTGDKIGYLRAIFDLALADEQLNGEAARFFEEFNKSPFGVSHVSE